MTTHPAHATNRSDPKSRGRQLRPPRLGVEAWWIVGAVLFAMLTAWASAHSLFPGEQELARWLQRHQYPTVLGYEEFADIVGARITLYVLSAFGLALFLVLRRWQLLALVAAAPLLTLAGHLLKVVIQRPRPDIWQVIDIREPTTGYSFPSGHSLQAAIIGVVAIILVQQLFTGRLRRFLQAGAVWLTVTVGWERVFDGVHWPTDVAGGFLLGTLLVTATWRGITVVAAGRSATRRPPGT
jgi:membrane-associated phospholipid phosphatase